MANGRKLTIGDLIYRLGFENEDQFVASLDGVLNQADEKLEKEGREAGRKGGAAASRGFDQQFRSTFRGAALGSFLGMALERAFASAVGAATKFAADSVREFAVYEQGLLQLKLAGEENLTALSRRIQDTARATRVFSATDVSLAVGGLVKAGFDAETAFSLVEAGALGAATEVDAATGKFGDLQNTAGQLGNVLRALGLDASQSSRVMDVLARAAQDSNLNVSDLVEIVGRVGPTAKLAGLEIEDLAAAAGVLANGGMEASQIGTGLRSVLLSLINPTGDLKGELDRLGVSLVDEQGNIRDFGTVLEGLHELTQRGGEGLQILTRATGNFGSTTASVLGASSDEVRRFTENMLDAEGTAEELADTMRNSAAGAAAEMQARMADARAELGEQLMPHMITLYETIFPRLVEGLGGVIALWEGAEFAIRGTTSAIEEAEAALQRQLVAGLGPELAAALTAMLDARQEVAEAQRALDEGGFLFGLGRGAFEQRLEEAIANEAAATERYEALLEQRRRQQQVEQDIAAFDPGAQFGPQLMPEGWTPEEIHEVTEAYRNLQKVREELAEAQAAFEAAGSAEEQAAHAARVRALKAEEAALLSQIEVRQQAAAASVRERDAIVDEAQRVQADLQRLKLAREQELVSRSWYEEQLEAHLRRLDGLLERAASPEQSNAVLRARKALLDELGRITEASFSDMAAGPDDLSIAGVSLPGRHPHGPSTAGEEAALKAAVDAELKRQEEIAAARVRNNQRMVEELEEQEAALYAWRQEQEDERAASQQAHVDELLALEAAALEYQLQQDIEARQRAAEEEEELEKKKAEARARNNQRMVNELLEQEAALYAWRAEQDELRAEREAELAELQRQRDRAAADAVGLGASPGAGLDGYVTLADRAEGVTVRLTQAQRTLGQATRDDVVAAVEGQISAIEHLLPLTREGSEHYYELVAALEAARAALAALNAEIPEFKMPELGSPEAIRRAFAETERMVASLRERIVTETDETVIAILEQRIAQYTALLRELGIAVAALDQAAADGAEADALQAHAQQLSADLMSIAKSFPVALAEGIRSGDIGGALEQALGGAADFFLDRMLDSILGPITEELTAAITKSLAARQAGDAASGAAGAAGGLAGLGTTGLVLGGVALLASMLIGAGRNRQRQAERSQQSVRSAVSGAPSVTYNLSANVEVNSNAAWSDPAFTARWRSETEALVVSLLSKVRRS